MCEPGQPALPRPMVGAAFRHPGRSRMPSLLHRASLVADVIRQRHPARISNMLVVGCGNGREAHALAASLRCNVTGIDLRGQFDTRAAAEVRLQCADATALPFDTAT